MCGVEVEMEWVVLVVSGGTRKQSEFVWNKVQRRNERLGSRRREERIVD
jgi:hypothetical protein